MIKNTPIVFAVENEYKIFIQVNESSVMWVRVGDENYYDHSNGVLRSASNIHKITVPTEELDKEKKYTVCYRKMIERKPYFSETSEVFEEEFVFYPLSENKFTIFQVADAHGMIDAPVNASKYFENTYGKIDMLVLNGDVIDHSGDVKNFDAIYTIASLITKGTIPVIFSRGNHDTRGIYAESIADYTPTRNGASYFSFKLGNLWGLVLDCGEDKLDSHEEYGNTNCCHAFRKEETKYLEKIVKNAKCEYEKKDVKRKIILSHMPFTQKYPHPFNIEEDTYAYWTKVLREEIKPDVLLCGHIHKLYITAPGGERDAYGQTWPTVVASKPDKKVNYFAGGALIFDSENITAVFCDGEKTLLEEKIN